MITTPEMAQRGWSESGPASSPACAWLSVDNVRRLRPRPTAYLRPGHSWSVARPYDRPLRGSGRDRLGGDAGLDFAAVGRLPRPDCPAPTPPRAT
jgi:hypothetical protein